MTCVAKLPANEYERVQRLRDLEILDSEREDIFDTLTHLTSRTYNVPVALISLIDADRQWFKSNVGLLGVTETPRDLAFCAHAILDQEIMVVSDALMDRRFFENPLVTGDPGIRFYAGAPLALSSSVRIGTLCIIDRAPRRLSLQELVMLRGLAQIVVEALLVREQLIISRRQTARSERAAHGWKTSLRINLCN